MSRLRSARVSKTHTFSVTRTRLEHTDDVVVVIGDGEADENTGNVTLLTPVCLLCDLQAREHTIQRSEHDEDMCPSLARAYRV